MHPYAWFLYFFMLMAAPLASILFFCSSWSKYKNSIPFTPEHDKYKKRLIVSAVVAGIVLAIFFTIMAIFGVTVFFANFGVKPV